MDIQVELEKDGTVKLAEIADRSRYGSDVQYRAAANAARQAVLACQPCLCRRKSIRSGRIHLWF